MYCSCKLLVRREGGMHISYRREGGISPTTVYRQEGGMHFSCKLLVPT